MSTYPDKYYFHFQNHNIVHVKNVLPIVVVLTIILGYFSSCSFLKI